MQIIFTVLIFTFICLILTYYYNLFITQNVYTRSELSDIFPSIGKMIQKMYSTHSIFYLLIFFLISSLFGVIILSIFDSIIINSALIPIILYFSSSRVALYFDQTRVTGNENLRDVAELYFSEYYHYILAGFYSGFTAKLIDNWINFSLISFYWLIINLIIITAITVITFKKDLFD